MKYNYKQKYIKYKIKYIKLKKLRNNKIMKGGSNEIELAKNQSLITLENKKIEDENIQKAIKLSIEDVLENNDKVKCTVIDKKDIKDTYTNIYEYDGSILKKIDGTFDKDRNDILALLECDGDPKFEKINQYLESNKTLFMVKDDKIRNTNNDKQKENTNTNTNINTNKVKDSIKKFLNQYHESNEITLDTTKIADICIHNRLSGAQEDAQEFLTNLLDKLKLDNDEKLGFRYETKTVSYCIKDGKKVKENSTSVFMNIFWFESKWLGLRMNFNDAIESILEYPEEQLKGDNQLERCKEKGLDSFISREYDFKNTNYLIISQKMFDKNQYKITTNLKVSKEITIDSNVFKRFGYIIHIGDVTKKIGDGGHYIAVIKKGDSWFELNDSTVKKIDENALDNNPIYNKPYIVFYKRNTHNPPENTNMRKEPIGINNMGNTCFLNAVMQNLFNNVDFYNRIMEMN